MRVKIDQKTTQKWSQDEKASWHRCLLDFGGFLEASWEGKWSQDRSKKALKKRSFPLGKTMISRVQGVEVGGKNRCKIDKKMESRWEDILGSIFSGFWWIFGGKLGGKMEPRSIQEGIEKAMEKWKAPRWPQDADRR